MTTITIPYLGDSSLCPIKALTGMCHDLPADKYAPLFSIIKKVASSHLKIQWLESILSKSPHCYLSHPH